MNVYDVFINHWCQIRELFTWNRFMFHVPVMFQDLGSEGAKDIQQQPQLRVFDVYEARPRALGFLY